MRLLNSLDEYIIKCMLIAGRRVDSFGVGERLITSSSEPVRWCLQLSAVEAEDGTYTPDKDLSENVAKITTPSFKEIWRLYDRETDKAIADVITLCNEIIDDEKVPILYLTR